MYNLFLITTEPGYGFDKICISQIVHDIKIHIWKIHSHNHILQKTIFLNM